MRTLVKAFDRAIKTASNMFFSYLLVIFQLNVPKPVGYCILTSKLIKKKLESQWLEG